jgi:N12 class adenine-specific DNA methylase
MAGNIFAGDLVQPLGAKRQSADTDPRVALDRLAAKHQIPANAILAALANEKDRSLSRAEALASEMAAQIKAGRGVEDVLRDRGGEDMLNAAYTLAEQLDPTPKPEPAKPSALRDMGLGAAGAAVRGVGGAIDYVGSSIDRALNTQDMTNIIGAATGRKEPLGAVATRLSDPASKAVKGAGESIMDKVSPEAREAAQKSLPSGDITDPSTWKGPEDFSWRGLFQVAAEGVGSLLPVVVTAIATRGNSLAAGAMGGAMAGGDGRETAAQVIDDLWKQKGADGVNELERQSSVYRDLTAGGMAPDAAYRETRKRAMDAAGDIQAVIGGAGGAFTGALVAKGLPQSLAGKSLAGNAARATGVGMVEEGVQEGAESVGARIGINAGAGTNLNPTEGTIEAAAQGALAGGPMSALGARRPPQEPPPPAPEPPPAPLLALPAPTNGGTIFMGDGGNGPGPSTPYPGDGSAGGQATVPDPSLAPPASGGTVADERPPAGPIEAAARLAPNMTPQPDPVAAPIMFPDQKPGAPVRLYDEEAGITRDVVFQRENPDGSVVVRFDGVEVDLDPASFDRARREAADRDKAAQQAAKGGKSPEPAPAPKPTTEGTAPITPPIAQPTLPAPESAPTKPGDEARTQQALGAVTPPAGRTPQQPITAEEAIRKMRQIEDRAAEGGWTGPMKRKYADLGKIAGQPAIDPETGEILDANDDGRGAGPADAGSDGPNPAGPRAGNQGLVEQPGTANNPANESFEPVVDQIGPLAGTIPQPNDALSRPPAPAPVQAPTASSADADDTAAKERKRREWRHVVTMANSDSRDDATLEGRDVLIRPDKIVIRATPNGRSDLDYTLDTTGLDRDTIAARLRGGLAELDRVSPLPAPEPLPTPKPVPTRAEFDAAAAETNPNPTPAQAEAENYKTAKIDWQGFRLSVENAKGSERKGTAPDGTEWKVTMPADYGRILRTKGADGDHVDFYMGPNTASESVWVVDQIDPDTGKFDEHKVMFGFDSPNDARATYEAGFSDGSGAKRMGGIRKMDLPEFKAWLDSGKTDKPVSAPARGENISPPPQSAEIVTVTDVYGDKHRVRKADLDNQNKAMLRRFNAQGNPIDGSLLARENIDQDGTAVAKTWADQPVIGGGRAADEPLSTHSAVRQAILRRGQNWADFDIKPFNGGFIGVRKPKAEDQPVQAPTIENIREKAAILRGVPKDQAPEIEGVSLKWDDKDGGFIFSRKHVDKVREAVMPSARGENISPPPAAPAAPPILDDRQEAKKRQAREAGQAAAREGRERNVPGWAVGTEFADLWLAGYADEKAKADKADKAPPAPTPQQTAALDPAPLEAVGMVKGESTVEDAWFRKQAEQGGIATYKAKSVPGGWRLTRDFVPSGQTTMPPTGQLGKWGSTEDAIAQLRENGMRTGVPEEATPPAPQTLKSAREKAAEGFAPGDRVRWGDNTATVQEIKDGYVRIKTDNAPGIINADGRDLTKIEATAPEAATEPTAEQLEYMDLVIDRIRRFGKDYESSDMPNVVGIGRIGEFLLSLGKKDRATLAPAADILDLSHTMGAGPEPKIEIIRELLGDKMADVAMQAYEAGVADAEAREAKANSPKAEKPRPAPKAEAKPKAEPAAKPVSGILSVLSEAEQNLASDLMAKLAAKARNQTSSGLDPEYITLGGQLVGLYLKAGTKRFAQMLRDFAKATGLSIREAQAPMRAAYNFVREEKDLAGEDVSDMDNSEQVMAEVRKMIAAEQVKPKQEGATVAGQGQPEGTEDGAGTRGNREGSDAAGEPETVSPNVEGESGPASGAGNLRTSEEGSRADTGRGGVLRSDTGREDAGGVRGGTSASRSNGTDERLPRNYRIQPGGLNDTRGEKTRAKDSIEAIRLLKGIEAQGRRATPAEQEKLALYAGAGSLNPAVPNSDGRVRAGWEDLARDLANLVSNEEMETIARTTQYAFYTSEEVVRGMWAAVERLGFKGGNVFEPGMGIGHFLGMSPEGLSQAVRYRGVELDSITARIARQLYPQATIQNKDYTQVAVPKDFYDLAIGNPPFANIEIKSDKKYPQKFLLHDYFFAKTLDSVRPGGLLAFVTSEGTMNKMDDKARQYLAERADLVGAIRLPNTAFKGSAGTEVTTDVIFLRKRMEGEPASDQSWTGVEMVPLPGLEGGRMTEFKVNRYFVQNPDMILGKHGGFGTMRFRGQYAVVPNEGEALRDAFAAAVRRLPANVMSDQVFDPTSAPEPVDAESGQTKAGSFYLRDGELWQYDGAVGRKVKRRGAEGGKMPAADYRKAVQFVAIRDALREVYAADLAGKGAAPLRARLNAAYDAFVAEHGPINKSVTQTRPPQGPALERARAAQRETALEEGRPWSEGSFDPTPFIDATMMEQAEGEADGDAAPQETTGKRYTWTQIAKMRKDARERLGAAYDDGSFNPDEVEDIEIIKRVNLNAIMDDPEVWRIAALEKYNQETGQAEKTKVFHQSILERQTEPEIRNAKDALNYVMAMRGYPDLDMIADKAGISKEKAVAELDGLIFRDPQTGRWENRDVYLSGNVRKKLAAARDMGGPEMERNIAALEAVLPRDLTEFDVTATLGMPWIPIPVVQEFAAETGIKVKVDRASAGGRWGVSGDRDSTEARVTWGTNDVPFPDLLEKMLNRTVIKVQRTEKNADGTTRTWLDEQATQAANEKAEAVREKFAGWIWADDARKESLLRLYNDRYNSSVAPTFDGSYLTTPGIRSGWSWRPHQLRAIARILQSGSTYLAHAVGAGKTSEMIAGAMEARRLGIARKPMFTVPNHMLGQFAAEFYDHYPTANILVADERRFHTDRRRQFIADAAANDYDAIILTHSSFQKIAVSDALNDEFVRAEIERFDEAIRASKEDGDRITTKEMERAKEKLEQRLRSNTGSNADAQLTFEEMGVDMLFVDEAHLFRKLDFATQLGAVKGVTPSGSKMAWDLFLKTRHLERVNPGRGIVLASGTPITNTMAELYTLSRYIQYGALEEQGLLDFDSWAQSFGETAIDYEPDAAGNYKAVSRFSKFVNTRDLSLMVRQRMDTVIPEDLAKYVVRPKLKGGARSPVAVPRSPAVEAYQDELAGRMKALEDRKGPPKKGDDNHLVIIGDGIAAATDMRLIDDRMAGSGSKLTRLAENVLRIWKDTADTAFYEPDQNAKKFSESPTLRGGAAQMVFADIQRRPGKSSFDTHTYIRDYLIRNGVPAEQIALYRDFKNTEAKRRLFRRVNDGEVRVLIGSAKAMGTGVNAQKRLIAMHNLDPHWYPALDEQRVGRILRQGNWNPEISVYDYATEGTYDSTMWQMMGRKARTIEDFLRGDPNINEMEDVGPASVFEQLAGMTTPDPRILRLKELQEEVKKLQRRRANKAGERRALESNIRSARLDKSEYARAAKVWEAVADKHIDLRGDKFRVTLDGTEYTERKLFGDALSAIVKEWGDAGAINDKKIGSVNGVPIILRRKDNARDGVFSGFDVLLPDDKYQAAILELPLSDAARRTFSLYESPVDTAKALTQAMNDVADIGPYYRNAEAKANAALERDTKALEAFEGFKDNELLEQREAELSALKATLDGEEEARRAKKDASANSPQPAQVNDDDEGMESRFDDRQPVATLTGDELGAWEDIRQLGKKAEAWYRDNMIGTKVVNAASGMEISFRREGAKKVSGRKGDVLLRLVPALREIIASGELTETQRDNKGNTDVAAWHTISATVVLDGQPRDIVAKVKETRDGKFHYDLSRDMSDGARHMRASGRDVAAAIGLEDNPVDINLDFAESEINGDAVPVSSLRDIARMAAAEIAQAGLEGKVTPRVVRGLLGASGVPIQGRQRGAQIEVNPAAPDARGVMRHEIVHALRDADLWGNPYGLFKPEEWRALVKAARADNDLMERVQRVYGDRSATVQIEEAVAELYREWAAARDAAGPVSRIFNKVRGFLQAVASALRGQGFASPALVMERIATGRVGGRGPNGPGGGRRKGAEMRAFHGTPHLFDRFSLSKINTGEGAQAYGWGLYFAGRKEVAKHYRDRLSDPAQTIDDTMQAMRTGVTDFSDNPRLNAVVSVLKRNGFRLEGKVWYGPGGQDLPSSTLSWMDDALARLAEKGELDGIGRGSLFEVDIPEDSELLDWDAPLSKQPEKVKAALRKLGFEPDREIALQKFAKSSRMTLEEAREFADNSMTLDADRTGQEAYTQLANEYGKPYPEGSLVAQMEPDRLLPDDQAASEALRDAGIPGHRYLDGTSRRDGDGSRNYVIYDDGRISVMDREMRAALSRTGAKAKGMIGSKHWKEPGAFLSSILTDAMVGKGQGGAYSLLSLVPGRPLLTELGKKLVAARAYLRAKEEMDALRNAWHGRADAVAQEWLTLRTKDPRSNDTMMDLMHRATLAGVDPSKPLPSDHLWLQRARDELSRRGDSAEAWARGILEAAAAKARAHAELKRAYDALPEQFRAMYGKVLNEYTAIADDFDKAVLENIQNATRIGLKRAQRAYEKEVRRIQDEGLTGDARKDALAEAEAKLNAVKARGGYAAKARLNGLRKMFEQNRMKGPYVPLARFGDYFVTVRNDQGEVISFSRFEREGQQQAFIREMQEQHPGKVQHGLISNKDALRAQVDPTFVADVERLLAESGAEFEVMDAVWQRWLETLPDSSIRTSKIHRKGRAGYNQDAFRAFGKHMFHGAHQLARLKHGILLEDHMDEAELEARRSDDPNRMGAIVREMQRRHDFTMNPMTSAWASSLSSLAFVWYLGATPAAAIANMTQTTVVGIPLMATRFKKAGVSGVSAELGRALRDFTKGRGANWRETWSAANAAGLPKDEVDALNEAYRRGTIDKTQAHDLASVAETGVEYSALRERVMRKIGWMFHHTERFNREVTFLAGYRLAKGEGLSGEAAINAAADMTWKVHFDYQSSSRPRAMQGDLARIVTTFRNFTVNMLWRLFRDTHQSLYGATPAEKAEARSQLIGVTLSMMAHAGIRGTWGYGIIMLLLGMFFPGGGDDAEDWLQDALLMEGDSAGVAAWNYAMGMALNGAPGKVLGLDLRERIGMPNLWFRGDDRDLEGQDLYDAHMREILGPVAGIPLGFYRGLDYAGDGDWWRGAESAAPKMIRDLMKAGRFSVEGVETRNGDPIIEDVSPYQAIMQASGFTPAQLAERYQINNRLKNTERRILEERSGLHKEAGDILRAGEPMPEKTLAKIREFNSRFPEYPITSETLRQSVMGRIRASERNEFGVALNPKLNDRLRAERPPAVYN